ncbi:capsular associated protein [Puccinia graminis f. sp. tritici]|uniref:Capsular associated protein n=1 Tax=Puccinia graminis f. sp. tritici TaxID=56615 RepID=A0A5B0RDJ8_PUCGR|nr:capsular associated protein [Puccinia graminis f. sp. tritici]KAA1123288.1 capsular associated protein [Puccinia graminis f. sp. tritici]
MAEQQTQQPIRRRRQSSLLNTNNHQNQNQNQNQPTTNSNTIIQMSQQQLLSNYLKSKLPALISLAIGIIVGLLFALILSSSTSNPSRKSSEWRGGTTVPTWTHSRTASTKFSVPIPTLDQRFRVFNLLSTLTGHHTQSCTKSSQKPYRRQVYERYEPLLGYDPTSSSRAKSKAAGTLHLFKHLVPGSPDPDQDFTGIIDFKGHSKLNLNNRRSSSSSTGSDSKQGDSSSSTSGRSKAVRRKGTGHKYFFAINLYNSFDVIPDLFSTMFKVSAILGFQNVFVSVYENGSSDQTKALLRLFDGLSRSVGIRVVIRTSLRTRGAFHHRIEYLAEVRNAALAPLQELRDSEGELFDTVIFMNDVLPCTDDLLELIWQSRRQNAGITCGADYIFHEEIAQPVFYDNWVARDINGTALENAPFESIFRDPPSQHKFERHLPIQVQSCWNGIAILDPAPLYAHPRVRFRMARLAEGECSASECSLICNDYWNAGYGRIVMVPRVKLAYDNRVWQIIHPERKNLTVIRGYTRLGGTPDDPTADPQDRAWFGPHDRLFRLEESEEIEMKPEPSYVWCWGWDGAGDLDGPDVDPIWEPTKNLTFDPRVIRHDRGFDFNF